ncbi:MAG TPA: threonine synthase [Steroidobacteraceae bacterium]|jgi:threonine synthase|nr:threonine synthase [Steroidobacteraceae bacterium]
MQFASTRNPALKAGFSDAVTQGLAPDGGLYVPTHWPTLQITADAVDMSQVSAQLLAAFVEGDAIASQMQAITREAFDFPAPLVPLGDSGRLSVLELFHGPTAAFKDFGARFLAGVMTRLRRGAARPLQILVATSGDTGGAVAAAFHRQPGIEVTVLFPKGMVSPTQERQLTCWGDNVRTLAVHGRFDDCQRLVKEAFADADLGQRFELSSANSINLGRLLPQAAYYWASSLSVWRAGGQRPSYIIPSGNLGNATACVWARLLGAPIGTILLAHNANRTVPDFLEQGEWRPRPSLATLSSAMDVGNPSNLERLLSLFPDAARLRGAVSAVSVDDDATRERIRIDRRQYGHIWCPHTAVAAEAFARLSSAERARGPWVIVATAHPAKFREIVEPLIGEPLPLPPNLAKLFDRPSNFREIAATLTELKRVL